MAQMEIKQDLSFVTDGLRFRSMFNTNRISRFDIERSYNPFYYDFEYFDRRTGEYSIYSFNETSGTEFLDFGLNQDLRQQSSVFYMEAALDYNRTFSDKHSLSGLLVYIMRSDINAKANSLELSLPSHAVGKDYMPLSQVFARLPSGTGFQLSLGGLLGIGIGREEGLEINVLGLVTGVGVRHPMLKVPGIGDIPLGG